MNDLVQSAGALEVAFRPTDGGRLARVRFAGREMILPEGRVPGFYGDTFWPSPQARWDWPPPPVLDARPYAVRAATASTLTLQSERDEAFGFQLEKRSALGDDCLRLEFILTNIAPAPQRVAPWQVTRAPREGLILWAAGEPFDDADRLRKQAEDPGCWYLHREPPEPFVGLGIESGYATIRCAAVPRVCKLFADARGWLAHVREGTLFLRVFPDLELASIAPRQGEVEAYFNPEKDYLELENQGAYQTLAPGASLRYPVEWHFARLLPGGPADRLSPELIATIETLLARVDRAALQTS